MQEPLTVLIVEDEATIVMYLKAMVKKMGHTVLASLSTGEEAVIQALARKPDVVLMDIMLAGEIDGIEAVTQIRVFSDAVIIFITGYAESEIHERICRLQNIGYLMKPINPFVLGEKVQAMCEEKVSRSSLN